MQKKDIYINLLGHLLGQLSFLFVLFIPNIHGQSFTSDFRGMDDVTDGATLQLATPSESHFLRFFSGRAGDAKPYIYFSDLDTFRIANGVNDYSNFTDRLSILPNGFVGINNLSPQTQLHIEGKLTLSDDLSLPIPGTIRYNASTQDFEGYTGSQWKSMTYKPVVYSYAQSLSEPFTFNARDTLLTFRDSLTIEEPGEYMCYFELPLGFLDGNTTTLSSDRFVIVYFHTYSSNRSKSIGPNTVGLPNGFKYYFRTQETVHFHRRFNFTAPNSHMFMRIEVQSNPCCAASTSDVWVQNASMHAMKIN